MANISVTLYDGSLDVSYDCSGAIKCKYAIWEEIPIDDNEHCAHRYCGSCRSSSAQIVAIENLKKRLTQHVKLMEMGEYA